MDQEQWQRKGEGEHMRLWWKVKGTWYLTGYGGGVGPAGGRTDLDVSTLDALENEDGPRDGNREKLRSQFCVFLILSCWWDIRVWNVPGQVRRLRCRVQTFRSRKEEVWIS